MAKQQTVETKAAPKHLSNGLPLTTEAPAKVLSPVPVTVHPPVLDKVEAGKPPASVTVTLRDAANNALIITTAKVKDGFKTSATHVVGKGKDKKVTRGASSTHPTMPEGVKAANLIVADATKAGWAKRTFTPPVRQDSFDLAHLPAPAKK